jgi:SAM-dependent methyltransferase
MVISTQVLEHVPNPAHYVAECFRVLKPGGSLLLTTHGVFHDHGCPYDFQRWTADGLRRLIEESGFRVDEVKKLTCGPRALCSLIHQGISTLRAPKTSFFGFCLWGFRGLWRIAPGWLNRAADRYFAKHAIVDAKDPHAILYVALLVHATRPVL